MSYSSISHKDGKITSTKIEKLRKGTDGRLISLRVRTLLVQMYSLACWPIHSWKARASVSLFVPEHPRQFGEPCSMTRLALSHERPWVSWGLWVNVRNGLKLVFVGEKKVGFMLSKEEEGCQGTQIRHRRWLIHEISPAAGAFHAQHIFSNI